MRFVIFKLKFGISETDEITPTQWIMLHRQGNLYHMTYCLRNQYLLAGPRHLLFVLKKDAPATEWNLNRGSHHLENKHFVCMCKEC
jgi:hypothetical protein